MTDNLAYRRILLKLSGEALQGDEKFGINPKILDKFAGDIKNLVNLGVEVGLVIGGGNLFRGAALSEAGLGRVTGDYMGMLATMMNCLAMRDALERAGVATHMMSALPLIGVIEPFDRRKALDHLGDKRVVLFSAGTGNPFFTTDSAASLRAIEIEADILLKATKVDGVYSADPVKNPSATLFESLSYDQVIEQNLKVMDATAICLCRDHDMLIRVFNGSKSGILQKIVLGESEGTLVQKRSVKVTEQVFKDAESRMRKTIESLQQELAKLRTGRAHPGLLDSVMVPYYGSDVPLSQVANVTIGDSRTILVAPWEKSMIAPIEKAIMQANLGLNPASVGESIRVPLPPLTEERRKDLTKVVKNEVENAKIAIRNIRRDANNHIKELLKAKDISEDEERKHQDNIQKITDKFVSEVDKMCAAKEKDLMEI